ncbi:MAG: hypothetical protein LC637_04335, partial [Xanthomonadaceae bacterium]|nr:hypothetical protein [Xanthomonadaceae bacterium]
ITLSIAAASNAGTGPRTVQVVTPAGASSTEPTAANRLYIGNPEQRLVTPLTAPVLGIARDAAPEPAIGLAYGPVVGLQKDVVENVEITQMAFSDRAGVARGAVLLGIEPSIIPRGFQGELILSGVELGLSATVVIESGEGIEITGPVVVEADADDNRFVRVPVAVDEQAAALPHRLVVVEPGADGNAPISFVTARAGQLQVAGDAPVIASISPIVTLPDEVFSLLIRGLNFEQATAVRVTPDQGVSVGSQLSINADGTELSVSLDVSQAAEPGPRLIQVIAPSGETDGTATAANTLTIVEP